MGLMSFHSPETLRRANPQLSDRELLGLPASFTPNRTLNLSADSFGALVAGGVAHWVDSLESQDCALAYRYTAGQILASVGDPRLNPLAPNMVLVPEATAQIGLACERLPAVMQSLADLNLDPDWIAKETPRHAVNLPAYKIGRYPVTNLEYKAFLLDSQAPRIPTDWFLGRYPLERANHPVSGMALAPGVHPLSAAEGRAPAHGGRFAGDLCRRAGGVRGVLPAIDRQWVRARGAVQSVLAGEWSDLCRWGWVSGGGVAGGVAGALFIHPRCCCVRCAATPLMLRARASASCRCYLRVASKARTCPAEPLPCWLPYTPLEWSALARQEIPCGS